MEATIEDRTESCLQVYLPCLKAVGQLFKICAAVSLIELQRAHLQCRTCLYSPSSKIEGGGKGVGPCSQQKREVAYRQPINNSIPDRTI